MGITDVLNIVTWNVRGLQNKEIELLKILEERKTNIAVITETKKKTKGTREIDDWVNIYSGVEQRERAKAGVAMYVDKKWKKCITSYTYINERMLRVDFKMNRGNLTVIGVYAPEEGRKEETVKFYDKLQTEVKNAIQITR